MSRRNGPGVSRPQGPRAHVGCLTCRPRFPSNTSGEGSADALERNTRPARRTRSRHESSCGKLEGDGIEIWPEGWKEKFSAEDAQKMAFVTDPDGYEVEILER